MNRRLLAALGVAAALLAGCVPPPAKSPPPPKLSRPSPPRPKPTPTPTPKPSTLVNTAGSARLAGVRPGPAIADLGLIESNAQAALTAFRLTCPGLVRRNDGSGLTRGVDWQMPCDAAATWNGRAVDFFQQNFEAVIVGDGQAFATGYYEPEILGSRTRRSGYEVPIYAKPNDIIEADLGLWSDDLKGKRVRGRVDAGKLVPYYDRGAIEDGALNGRGLEIAYAADPVEFFFLQVQGSGRLRLPDGSVMRIGYDGQNGRDYVGIGKLLRDRGLLQPGEASMQGIMGYLRRQPDKGDAVMRENKSFVFFKELKGAGPLGAMGQAVTGRTSAAADPSYVPLGAPVFLQVDRAEATGLWVAQDTGGAIKGSNRFDTFWGAGDEARTIAGGMSARGRAFLLLPKGSVARVQGAAMAGRRLDPDEAGLWRKVVATVRPLHVLPRSKVPLMPSEVEAPSSSEGEKQSSASLGQSPSTSLGISGGRGALRPPPEAVQNNLDGGWDRRLRRGVIDPDMTVDLHGHTLASAHAALDHALARAIANGTRVILLVTGKPLREDASGKRRGLIRASVHDWLGGSRFAGRIAAVRGAHPRHGGAGALYVILRRERTG